MTGEQLSAIVTELGRSTRTVVTAHDLRLCKVPTAAVSAAVARKELRREVKGIYVPHTTPDSDEVRAHIGLAHAGEGAVLTGLLAARWLGLRWVPKSTEVHFLVPKERRRRGTESVVRIRRCGWLEELDARPMYGVPVAPVAQVVVDGARELTSLQDVRGLVLGAVADKRCTVAEIRALLDRSATAGTALVRRVCVDAERGAASPPEAELADALMGRGIPFYVNVEVRVDGVLLGVSDVWLLGRGTGGELDSREWHEESELLDQTLLRHKRFPAAGLSLEHITPARFRRDRGAFVATLFAEAARREAQGIREPAGLTLTPRGPLLR